MSDDLKKIAEDKEPESKVDSERVLVRYGTLLAFQGRVDPMGLASLGRPPGALLN